MAGVQAFCSWQISQYSMYLWLEISLLPVHMAVASLWLLIHITIKLQERNLETFHWLSQRQLPCQVAPCKECLSSSKVAALWNIQPEDACCTDTAHKPLESYQPIFLGQGGSNDTQEVFSNKEKKEEGKDQDTALCNELIHMSHCSITVSKSAQLPVEYLCWIYSMLSIFYTL